MRHHHVFLLGGDVALCCMVLFTHLPVMSSVPRAAHTDTHLTQHTASTGAHILMPTGWIGLPSSVITPVVTKLHEIMSGRYNRHFTLQTVWLVILGEAQMLLITWTMQLRRQTQHWGHGLGIQHFVILLFAPDMTKSAGKNYTALMETTYFKKTISQR